MIVHIYRQQTNFHYSTKGVKTMKNQNTHNKLQKGRIIVIDESWKLLQS